MDLNKEADKLAKNFEEITGQDVRKVYHYSSDKKDAELDEEYKEIQRLNRMEEIWEQANDNRVKRREAESQKRGYTDTRDFVSSEEYATWALQDEEPTPIEIEYNGLCKEQFHLNWFRKHGEPYRMEDDPNAKF